MSNPANLPLPIPDSTVNYFNNFFGPAFTVSTEVDGVIVSYFEKMTGSTESAKLMAGSVIYTAKAQNLDPMLILQEFINLPKNQLNSYLAYFLNQNRIGTSLLGLSNAPMTNKYLTRTILP